MDEDVIYEVGKYTINFTRKHIKYWIGRYQGDNEYNYIRFNNDAGFYSQAVEILKDAGRDEIREGIKRLLDVQERY